MKRSAPLTRRQPLRRSKPPTQPQPSFRIRDAIALAKRNVAAGRRTPLPPKRKPRPNPDGKFIVYRLPKLGRRGKAWEAMKRRLRPAFAKAGVTSCEIGYVGCWGRRGLTWAHRVKRRFIKPGDAAELATVALACLHCHPILEVLPHAEMRAVVDGVIFARKTEVRL